MASKDRGAWVAPRNGGYVARSQQSGRFVSKDEAVESSRSRAAKRDVALPPGRGSAAKAK